MVRMSVLAWESPNADKAITGVGVYLSHLADLGNFARKLGYDLDLTFIVPWERDAFLQEDGYSIRLLETSGFNRKNPYGRDVLYSAANNIAERLLNDESQILRRSDVIFVSSFAFGELISRAPHLDNIVYISHRPEFLHRSIAEAAGVGQICDDRFRKDCALEAKAIGGSHRILTVGEACKEKLVTYYKCSKADVNVIYNGVDTSLFRPADRSQTCDETVFSYVGRSDPEKGTVLLLEAVKDLKDRVHMDGFKLLLVTDDSAKLEKLVERLCISDHVDLVAWKHYRELPQHYSEVDFTVIPSFWESFSFVAVESLSCETPVIASTAGELSRIVDPNVGLSFQTGDKSDLTDTLRKACELSKTRTREMGIRGREKVLNRFSRERFLTSYLEFIESIVHDRPLAYPPQIKDRSN